MKFSYPLVVFMFLSLLMLAPLVSAGQDMSTELFSAKDLKIDLELSGKINIVLDSSQAAIDYVTANLSFRPQKSSQQKVTSLEYVPMTEGAGENYGYFRWNSPSSQLTYTMSSTIETIEYLPPVKKDIRFPVLNLPDDVLIYTQPSEMIDSDSAAVVRMATKLAEGESELYSVVFNIGKWVEENVEYDLNSLTAEATYSASWVLDKRSGVCDEISTLFIAMVRSLGIPARYISGLAYTNFQDKNDWGAHGWAEVYFPNVGWVPFDVTYSQFGYVDPTHIILKYSVDSNEPAIKYQWLGKDVSLEPDEMKTTAALKMVHGQADPKVSLSIVPHKREIGFGSSNLLEASVTNIRDRTLVADVHLTRIIGLTTKDSWTRYVLLNPGETKKIYWTVATDSDWKPSYYYTYPLNLSSGSVTVSSSFTEKGDGTYLSFSEVSDLRKAKEDSTTKSYTRDVSFECETSPEHLHLDMNPLITCTITNAGNTVLTDLKTCIDTECETLSLGIAKSGEMSHFLSDYEAGERTLTLRASNTRVSKIEEFDVELLDAPLITLSDITAPSTVDWGYAFDVKFSIEKTSYSIPQSISVKMLDREVASKEDLTVGEKHIISVDPSLLLAGESDVKVLVTYKDALGRDYSSTKSFHITLEGAPFLKQLEAFFINIWDSMFPE